MESLSARLNKFATRRILKKAARWAAELREADRNDALENKVQLWIAKDSRHAAAFESIREGWRQTGNVPRDLPPRAARPNVSVSAFAGMAVLCITVACAVYFLRDNTLVTGPAEQRTVELNDGTEVSLNANSRVIVQYDDRVRKLTLDRGEVLFNVIKHQPRPFVVVVGDRKVIAMGTSFVVRREEPAGSAFAVTLVEGRVAIEPISAPDLLPGERVAGLKLLNPGERLRFAGNDTERRDSLSIERATAWRLGQLIFEDTSLSEASAEFNRYGPLKIVIDGPELGRLRVGGVFRIGDPTSFANAMANGYHLRIISRANTIILTDRRADQ